jgi:hypothetical protein
MVKFIAGKKGEGKTKRLIEMANETLKVTEGHVVFLEVDKKHIHDLHYDIRFVATGDFPIAKYGEFAGFICGILSQNADITEVFVDGLTKIVDTLDFEDLVRLIEVLEGLSEKHSVNFVIHMNCEDTDAAPKELKDRMI